MPTEDIISTGVCLRVEDGYFRVFPYENPALVPFEAAVRRLNPVVAVKLRSAAVTAAIRKMFVSSCLITSLLTGDTSFSGPDDDYIYIDRDTRIQVIQTIGELPQAEKDQCGAFIVRSLTRFLHTSCDDSLSAMNDPWYFGLMPSRRLYHFAGILRRNSSNISGERAP